MFKEKYPQTWTFHRSTCRSELNTIDPLKADTTPDVYKEYLGNATVLLPQPNIPAIPLDELIRSRYSCRQFTAQALSLQHVANTLYAGYGMNNLVMLGSSEFRERTVPSGGGLYPLELYLLVSQVDGLQPGIYHYVIYPALLELVTAIELPKKFLETLFMQQPYVADAPLIVVATAVIERSMKKYFDRGYRYMLLEAGHAFQNMNLAAAAGGLGSLNIGGFFDLDMGKVLGIDIEEEIPLYAMALGMPAGNRTTNRLPNV